MKPICLFEAGGTKTTLLVDRNGAVEQIALPGFNPNRYSPEFEKQFALLELPADAHVIFYGSGLSSVANKKLVQDILAKKFKAPATIEHDQLGAARALWGDDAGLTGILGTGAFAAWYDGQKLIDRKGGHGYLIDDIGGGLELGKIVLSQWLNGDLPKPVDEEVSRYTGIEKADFTTVFYKNPDLSLIAGASGILLKYLDNARIQQLLTDYFLLYFKRHVAPVLKNHPTEKMGLVGGISVSFEPVIRACALQSGISIVFSQANPAVELLNYHRKRLP